MDAWEITYILIAFAGLMIGWQVNIYLAVVFIWALIILAELLDARKSRSHSQGQGHNLD